MKPGPICNALLLALLVAFTWSVVPKANSKGSDIGSLMLGTPDEYEIAKGIHGMFVKRTLNYEVPAYPGVYPMLSYSVAKPISRIVGFNERNLILILRWFSVAFGVATLLSVYLATRAVGGSPWAGLIATAFLASSPEHMVWAVRIHPDSLLLFELVLAQLAIALGVHKRSQAWLITALVMMALATMTKIVGVFLLPWLVAAQAFLDLSEGGGLARVGLRFTRHVAWGALLFLAIAYLTTPMLLVDMHGFFNSMQTTQSLTSSGWQRFAAGLGWLELFGSDMLAGPVGATIYGLWALSFLPLVIRTLRDPQRRITGWSDPALRSLPFALFGWGFLGYLMVFTKNFQVRYAMPALPSAAVSFGLVVTGALPQLERVWAALRKTRRFAPAQLCGALLFLAYLPGLGGRASQMSDDHDSLEARARDPRLEVGTWLNERAPADARIIFDYYVYVPIKFAHAFVTWGLLESQVTSVDPSYILIHDERRSLFTDEEAGEGDESARWYHKNRVQTLARLERGELAGFKRVRRFDAAKITVYQNQNAQTCPTACSLAP